MKFTQIERDNIMRNFLRMDMPQERRSRIIRLARFIEAEGGDPDDLYAAIFHYSRPENHDEFEATYESLDLADWYPGVDDGGAA